MYLKLLGPPQVDVGSGTPPRLGAKPLALLAYLALEPGPHPRDKLAGLLWSDSAPPAARASLRQALRQLRDAAGDALAVSRQTVELTGPVSTDVHEFLAALDETPERAAAYDISRFLAGLDLGRTALFNEWAEGMAGGLRRRWRAALRETVRHAMARSHWRDAARHAERWVAREPLSDEATRLLVEALYMTGDRAAALAQYEEYRTRVAAELGTTPAAPLAELAARLAAGPGAPATTVPGPEEPLPAYLDPPLLEREHAWGALADTWTRVRSGGGAVAVIEGEAGFGKSRLADEFLQWVAAEGGTVLPGRGYDPGGGLTYAPVAEALRAALDAPGLPGTAPEWLAEAARVLPELTVRFPTLPAPSAPGDTDRRWRLFEAIAQVLQTLAAERPVVLFIDDLQHCDAETCALLHFLVRRLRDVPVLLLLTATIGEPDRAAPGTRLHRALHDRDTGSTIVALAPLSEEAIRTMIRDLGRVCAPDGARRFARQVHAVTDGNPFHAMELLKALFAQGMLTTDPETGEWLASARTGGGYDELHLPRTVRDAVMTRYTRLPYELRDLLATVATTEFGTSTHLLSFVHGISRLRAAALADALVERRLLTGADGQYLCAHPVIRDVVRDDLTDARRSELHRAIATALERMRDQDGASVAPGDIARHAARGGARALAYREALRAAERAVAHQAHEDALTWLDAAARSASSDTERAIVNARTAALLDAAGLPVASRGRRPGTPARGIVREDLDLKIADRR